MHSVEGSICNGLVQYADNVDKVLSKCDKSNQIVYNLTNDLIKYSFDIAKVRLHFLLIMKEMFKKWKRKSFKKKEADSR